MLIDLLHLSRNLRRSPASAVAAILTLTLTLGAGGAIFAIVDAVLLTPPPFLHPDALVVLREVPVGDPGAAPRTVSYATFERWRERAGSLGALEPTDGTNLTLTELGTAERVNAVNVMPGFFTLLGVTPALGRGFVPDDVSRPVVVVSHGFWRGRLAADPNAIGRRLVLGGQPHTIVGVLPERVSSALTGTVLWRPFPVIPGASDRVGALARLAGATSPAQLAEVLEDVSRASAPPARVVVMPIWAAMAAGATRTLALLAGAAALAMLIAFTNLAGLLLVRSIDRRRELAVRTALGARRSEVAKQLLMEAHVLVAFGTMGGVLLALWLTPAVGHLALQRFGDLGQRDISVSWRVIAMLAIAASACASICGWLPALVASRQSVADVLRRGFTAAPGELLVRRTFVMGVVALAFVMLVSLTLLGRSLIDVLHTYPGFQAEGVLNFSVSLPAARYSTDERVVSFYAALQHALEQRLGPREVAVVDELPLDHDRGRRLVGQNRADATREAVVRSASANYFDVMRIPVIDGRAFDARDTGSVSARAIVSRSLADRLFPHQTPVGRALWFADGAAPVEIIGVVGDVKHRGLDEGSSPTVYLSGWQSPSRTTHVLTRSEHPDADVAAAVRDEVARLDSELPVYGQRSMRDIVAASPGVPARRVLTAAFTGLSLLAVVLGGIGLFGVVAHDVASRRAELALRIALGAEPARILRATLRQGAIIVGVGLAAGTVLSMWGVRALKGFIVASGALDPVAIASASALLILVGVAATLPVARRAAQTDPLIVLRGD